MRERRSLGHRQMPGISALRAILLALVFTASASGVSAAENKYAAIVVDAKTGKTLFSRNADAARYPASLTKMMTL